MELNLTVAPQKSSSDIMEQKKLNIFVLDYSIRKNHYTNIIQNYDANYYFDTVTEDIPIDIVLIGDEYYSEISTVIIKYKQQQIPVLHIIDGIVEWRNVWENPRSTDPKLGPPLFQPILADKISCIGAAQARIIESWNNYGKCEIVGFPRLNLGNTKNDRYSVTENKEAKKILVATANTPGFTEQQNVIVKQSLNDLNTFFKSTPSEKVEVIWRISPKVSKAIKGIENTYGLTELKNQLETVDVVITTPSTLALEAMLIGIPVVIIDYTNSPQFLPAAWFINNSADIAATIQSALTPSPERINYQEIILHDQLQCENSATDNLKVLIETMVEHGRRARLTGQKLNLPHPIIKNKASVIEYDIATLNPRHSVLKNTQKRTELLIQIAHLEKQLAFVQKKHSFIGLCTKVLKEIKYFLKGK